MATDSVIEVLVKRNKGKSNTLKMVGIALLAALIIGGGVLLSVLTSGSMMAASFLSVIAAIVLAVFLFNRLNVEYEYTFFGGEVTIDRIYNQSNRSMYVEFNLKEVEQMGRFDESKAGAMETKLICSADETGIGSIYLKVPVNNIVAGKHVSLNGSFVYIVLENNERVMEALKSGLRANVYREGIRALN